MSNTDVRFPDDNARASAAVVAIHDALIAQGVDGLVIRGPIGWPGREMGYRTADFDLVRGGRSIRVNVPACPVDVLKRPALMQPRILVGPDRSSFAFERAVGMIVEELRDQEADEDPVRVEDRRWCEAAVDEMKRLGMTTNGAPARPFGLRAPGCYRLYFNRHGAAPLVWCVAPEVGGWELAVKSVEITAPCATVYTPKPTADDEDGQPSAWIRVEGVLTVDADGHATVGPA